MGLPVEILPNLIGSSSGATAYQVSRSLRFRSAASATLTRTPSVTSNRRTFTFSAWVKRGSIGTTTGLLMAQQGTSNGNLTTNIGFGSDDKLSFDIHTNSTLQIVLCTTASVFRDPSAWYHIVFAIDTTQATNSNGVKIYVNGVQQTLTYTNYTQNADSAYNTVSYPAYFARYWGDGSNNSYSDCYMTQVHFIDGQQLTPSSFGETDSTTGVWKPKAYSGTYGTNGFYLPFTDNSLSGNLALYSSMMNNSLYGSTWVLGPNSTQIGTTTAPDGSSNAVTYSGTGSGGNQYLGQVVAFGAATTYTVSVWAKLISGSTPTSGQIITSEYNNGSTTVRSAVNYNGNLTSSWKRFSTTFTNVTAGNYNVYFAADQNTTAQIAIWGAQIEAASSAGPYYPTTSSIVAGISKVGADYSVSSTDSYNNWTPTNISVSSGATTYSGYFNGSSYFEPPSSANLALGSGNFTLEFWFKKTGGPTQQSLIAWDSNLPDFEFDTSKMRAIFNGAGTDIYGTTTISNDVWYHVAYVRYGTTLSIYVNGVSEVSTTDTNNLTNTQPRIGQRRDGTTAFTGYISNLRIVKGVAVYVSKFTVPASPLTAISGTQLLTLQNATLIDNSTNNFSLTNSGTTISSVQTPFTPTSSYDSMIDVPTNYDDGGDGRGNYPTLNSLQKSPTAFLSDGNLRLDPYGTGVGALAKSTFGGSGGIKFYVEFNINSIGSGGSIVHCAICDTASNPMLATFNGNFTYYRRDGNIDGTTYATYTSGDIIAAAVDTSAGTVSWYKNNVLQVTRTSVSYDAYFTMFMVSNAGGSYGYMNFGQRPFAYTPPTGYKALNTQNLPTPTIVKGNAYMDATLYTGTGAALTATNSGSMQPDLLWLKNRSLGVGGNHTLFDSVRGGPSTELYTSSTAAESAGTGALTSLNANGFTLGNAGDLVRYNQNTNNYVAWQWKKGATPGFDIVTYTGNGTSQNITHSLGVVPSMIILKSRSASGQNWNVYHTSLGNGKAVLLNSTLGEQTSGGYWNSTTPTSSVFSIGNDGSGNTNAATYIAYLFAEVAGFSRFSSYTGNGNADGPFVSCGFRPRFVMIKRSTTDGESWGMYDSSRNLYNQTDESLYANLTNVPGTGAPLDFLSNGFKVRTTNSLCNSSSATYIFAAFAENPFKYALAR